MRSTPPTAARSRRRSIAVRTSVAPLYPSLMLGQSVEYNLYIHSALRMGPSEEPTEPAETRRNLIRVGGVSLRGRALPYRSGPHRRNRRATLARNRRGPY